MRNMIEVIEEIQEVIKNTELENTHGEAIENLKKENIFRAPESPALCLKFEREILPTILFLAEETKSIEYISAIALWSNKTIEEVLELL